MKDSVVAEAEAGGNEGVFKAECVHREGAEVNPVLLKGVLDHLVVQD